MNPLLQPWQLLLPILVGWINHREQEVIGYLRTENRVLREKLGRKRVLLNDDQRRRLAVKGKILGRKMIEQVATILTPDTILRWRRELVAAKWDYSERRKKIGRPPASAEVVELVLRMARENPGWGYDRVQGALANLGHLISNTSVSSILKAHGVDPAPDRKRQSTWKSFLIGRVVGKSRIPTALLGLQSSRGRDSDCISGSTCLKVDSPISAAQSLLGYPGLTATRNIRQLMF